MLTLLRKNIRRGLKRHILMPDDDSKEDEWKHNDSIMVGIEGAMDRLSRLALIIRSSNKTSNFQSVLKHSRSRGPDGFDDLIMALVRWRFGPTETNNCQAQFGMPESLQLQLGSSIIYRRNRLVYEFRRQRKFEADRDREDVSETTLSELPEDAQRAAILAMTKTPEASRASQKMPEMVSDALNTRSSQQNSLLQTVLTKGMARALPGDDTASYASTNRSTNPFIDAEYPKAPTLLPGHSSVRCTFCRKPQSRKTINDDKLWRRHVNEDLQPYVCVSEECGNFPPSFSSRRSWRDHMREHHRDWTRHIHRQHRWKCAFCQTESLLFDSEQLLLQHLEHQHRSEVPLAQLGIIASRGKTHVPLDADTCPFCGENITLESSQNSQSPVSSRTDAGGNDNTPAINTAGSNTRQATSFATSSGDSREPLRTSGNSPAEHKSGALSIKMRKHIADHLESMALWSLRWWAEDSGISQEIEEEGEEDSCNPEVKMSQDALSDDDSRGFEDRIFDSFEASQFPHPGEEFLPANMIDIIVTKDVLLEMFPDMLDTTDGAMLASYILGTSKRLFAITALHCGFNPDDLLVCMTSFKRAGFDDELLPIPDPKINSPTIYEVFTSSAAGKWGRAKLGNFYRFQWRYLSPVFSTEQFQYTFQPSQIMPFISVSQISQGFFSRVVKASIHQAHWTVAVPTKNTAPVYVALKEFFWDPQDIDDNKWETESRLADEVRRLHHTHIVDPLASIFIGPRRFFIYEWADGGNLHQYWKEVGNPELSRELVVQVIIQLQGLADALCQLHKSNIRHGHLNPENIMRSQGPSSVGTLMLGDFGFDNRNVRIPKRLRLTGSTSRRDGTITYDPPDYEALPDGSQPFQADVWSMGCIMFEFIVWLLYGWDDILSFHSRLNENLGVFYEMDPRKGPRLNSVVDEWTKSIESDPRCNYANGTALGDLVQLIRQRALVVNFNEGTNGEASGNQAAARKLHDGLTDIIHRGKQNKNYFGMDYDQGEVLRHLKNKKRLNNAKKNKLPIKFKDAVGRKFSFPFHICSTWAGMEELIKQAFLHVDIIGVHVQAGRYDLLGPNNEIIRPQDWDELVEPDWTVEMRMWPLEKVPAEVDKPLPAETATGTRQKSFERDTGKKDVRRRHRRGEDFNP